MKIAVPHFKHNDYRLRGDCFVHCDLTEQADVCECLFALEKNTDAAWYGVMGPAYYPNFNLAKDNEGYFFRSREYLTDNFAQKLGLSADVMARWAVCAQVVAGEERTLRAAGKPQSVLDHCRALVGNEAVAIAEAIGETGMKHELDAVLKRKSIQPALTLFMSKQMFRDYLDMLRRCLLRLDERTEKKGDVVRRELTARLLFAALCEKLAREGAAKLRRVPLVHVTKSGVFTQPEPAYTENLVPVAAVASREYIPVFAALLQSILEHASREMNYDVFLLTRDGGEYLPRLNEMARGRENVTLRVLDPAPVTRVKDFKAGAYHTPEAYYKLYAPWLFERYQRMLVLDCDVLAASDVAPLLSRDLAGNPIGAVRDAPFCALMHAEPDVEAYEAFEVGLCETADCANGGVLLMDLELMRGEMMRAQCTEYCKRVHARLEQDTLNKLYHRRIAFLEPEWNCFAGYDALCADPKLIHFAGARKPWLDPSVPYAEDFWRCAKKTPFYDELQAMRDAAEHADCGASALLDRSFLRAPKRKLFPELWMANAARREERIRARDEDYRDTYKITSARRTAASYGMAREYRLKSAIPKTFAYVNNKKILALKDVHKGKRAFFVGQGPSLRIEDLERLKDEITFSVNAIYRLYADTDWRVTYYMYDQNLFVGKSLLNDADALECLCGCGEMSFFPFDKDSEVISRFVPNAVFLPIVENAEYYDYPQCTVHNWSGDISRILYTGGTSMFVNMQIAAYMGIREMYIVGADARYKPEKAHAYAEDAQAAMSNQSAAQATIAINDGFLAMKRAAARLGIKLCNATRGGYLEALPRVDFDSLF